MKITVLKENPFIAWGRVELYHAQHNELPGDKELDYVKALHAAAGKVMNGTITTHNAGTMLIAAAERIKKLEEKLK